MRTQTQTRCDWSNELPKSKMFLFRSFMRLNEYGSQLVPYGM
jgi:hypothetical protein